MQTLPLQLLTIETEDGQRWIFVGSPAVMTENIIARSPIVDVWFSNIQNIPQDASIASLIEMIERQTLHKVTGTLQ